MNMGDFRGSDVPSEGMFNTNGTFQFLDGMSSSDRDQIKDLLGNHIKISLLRLRVSWRSFKKSNCSRHFSFFAKKPFLTNFDTYAFYFHHSIFDKKSLFLIAGSFLKRNDRKRNESLYNLKIIFKFKLWMKFNLA